MTPELYARSIHALCTVSPRASQETSPMDEPRVITGFMVFSSLRAE